MSIATDTTPTIRDSRQALIDAIKAHMAREGLTRTGFGRAALGDASFLGRLGRGADVRFSTADKVLAFMGKEQWADPKQAIYRFRGADIAAYVRAREAFRAQAADGVLPIATNFRSCAPIMEYVNERFETLLSEENDQPGFQALDPFQPARAEGLSVAALDIAVADEKGKASAALQRDGEAEAVAEMCAGLIGSELIRDPRSGEQRPCRAGDIALLAPTGSELWRYEEALEQHGIPVATQAGKGLYRRREVQDLIAVTRVLADQRDTLALGALLRGPLVGLTEEELLDIVWALPRADDAPDELPRLDLRVGPESIAHDHARDIIQKLQALHRQVNATTPHALYPRPSTCCASGPSCCGVIAAKPSGRSPMSISTLVSAGPMRYEGCALSPKR